MTGEEGQQVTHVDARPAAHSPKHAAPPQRSRVHTAALLLAGVAGALVLLALVVQDGSGLPDERATSAPEDPAQRLTWAPPVLREPEVIRLDGSVTTLELQPDRDYRIVLPAEPLRLERGLRINGGYNVVLVGGEIVVPTASQAPEPEDRRGLMLKGQFGTVHVEGLRISGADLTEGINLDQREGGTVQLQNIAIARVNGSLEGNHADLVQAWAGPRFLRIDGLQGETQYQGMFLTPTQFGSTDPEAWDIRRVVIRSDADAPGGKTGYLLWTSDEAPWLTAQDILLVDPRAEDDGMLRPYDVWAPAVTVSLDESLARLPAGQPGIDYVSPGYIEESTP